jgi:hypothetical protein
MPKRFMFDSNVADALLADEALRVAVHSLMAAGVVGAAKTLVQDEEHAATPNPERRAALADIFSGLEVVAPSVFVLDRPNIDCARFGGPDEHAIYDRVWAGKSTDAEDGIIAATAHSTCDVLVTEDRKLATRVADVSRTLAWPVEVWNVNRFRTFVADEMNRTQLSAALGGNKD